MVGDVVGDVVEGRFGWREKVIHATENNFRVYDVGASDPGTSGKMAGLFPMAEEEELITEVDFFERNTPGNHINGQKHKS